MANLGTLIPDHKSTDKVVEDTRQKVDRLMSLARVSVLNMNGLKKQPSEVKQAAGNIAVEAFQRGFLTEREFVS